MTPQRAHDLGVRSEVVSIASDAARYSGKWVVRAGECVLTEFPPDDVFGACRWLADLQRLEQDVLPPL